MLLNSVRIHGNLHFTMIFKSSVTCDSVYNKTTNIYPKCVQCGKRLEPTKFCIKCKKETDKQTHCGLDTVNYTQQRLDIRDQLNQTIKKLNVSLPPLIKGVRGTSNKTRVPEALEKGVLRAVHDIYVNKFHSFI